MKVDRLAFCSISIEVMHLLVTSSTSLMQDKDTGTDCGVQTAMLVRLEDDELVLPVRLDEVNRTLVWKPTIG